MRETLARLRTASTTERLAPRACDSGMGSGGADRIGSQDVPVAAVAPAHPVHSAETRAATTVRMRARRVTVVLPAWDLAVGAAVVEGGGDDAILASRRGWSASSGSCCWSGLRRPVISAGKAQRVSNTPQQAAEALTQAASTFDEAALRQIFGPGADSIFLSSERPLDRQRAAEFAARAREKLTVETDPSGCASQAARHWRRELARARAVSGTRGQVVLRR